MRQRILVTGGNGYVGREVVRLLLPDHDVHVLDSLRRGPARFAPDELARIGFSRVDISDGAAVCAFMREIEPDTIIHLAAIHYIPECEAHPSETLLTNVVGTVNMLLACPEGARFVYASSGAVYAPDARPHTEDSRRAPSDIYGMSKLQGEDYVRYFAAAKALSAVVVRLFNVVGPGETNPHLLPEIVAQLKAGRRTVRLGNLWPKRDYIHVRDAARGFVATALEGPRPAGETVTVNLGTSQAYSVGDIIEKLRRVADLDFALIEDRERVRKVDRPFLAADRAAIRERFGWEPRLTIDDALADLWREPDLSQDLMVKYR